MKGEERGRERGKEREKERQRENSLWFTVAAKCACAACVVSSALFMPLAVALDLSRSLEMWAWHIQQLGRKFNCAVE